MRSFVRWCVGIAYLGVCMAVFVTWLPSAVGAVWQKSMPVAQVSPVPPPPAENYRQAYVQNRLDNLDEEVAAIKGLGSGAAGLLILLQIIDLLKKNKDKD